MSDVRTQIGVGFHVNHGADDDLLVRHEQNVEDILDANKREAIDNPKGMRPGGNARKVASIPLVVWVELERQGIAQDQARLRRWLNDPDNRFFRTSQGRA